MENQMDIVESLIRTAGRRAQPPEAAYRQVFAAASAALRKKTARRRERRRLAWAAAAAVLVLAVALIPQWSPPAVNRDELARIARIIGVVEGSTGDAWQPLDESRALTAGMKLRTLRGGRAVLALASGESLRLAAETEVMLDAPGRYYVERGTIYVDSGARPGTSRLEIVTPAGTARDLGTQFELHIAGASLRLRVREGIVSIDRSGRSLTGMAGEQVSIDDFGGVSREAFSPSSPAWQWAESLAPVPDVDGKPAAVLIYWAARETGRRLRYESSMVEQRASTVILHGNIRHLSPLAALDAMLATTDLEYVLDGDTIEIRTRNAESPLP